MGNGRGGQRARVNQGEPPVITTRMHALTIITHLLEDVAEKPERLARAQQLAHEQVGPLFDHVAEDCAAICEREADATDGRLPDATGGRFAKKFAANCLRGAAAKIRKTFATT